MGPFGAHWGCEGLEGVLSQGALRRRVEIFHDHIYTHVYVYINIVYIYIKFFVYMYVYIYICMLICTYFTSMWELLESRGRISGPLYEEACYFESILCSLIFQTLILLQFFNI